MLSTNTLVKQFYVFFIFQNTMHTSAYIVKYSLNVTAKFMVTSTKMNKTISQIKHHHLFSKQSMCEGFFSKTTCRNRTHFSPGQVWYARIGLGPRMSKPLSEKFLGAQVAAGRPSKSEKSHFSYKNCSRRRHLTGPNVVSLQR